MKKTLLTSVFILSIFISFSQGNEATKYGVRAGWNLSNVNFSPSIPGDDNRYGFFFGGFAEFSLSETLWLNTELHWSAEGSKDEDLRANYINVPIQLRFLLG